MTTVLDSNRQVFFVGVTPPTGDYNYLDNKPAIDGVTLYSDTTKADLGLDIVFKYKGQVNTYTDLPKTGNLVGDTWNVKDTGENYCWNGSDWDCLSGATTVYYNDGTLQSGGNNVAIDVDKNNITNIETDNLKSGVLQTTIRNSSTATDTSIPSEKAVRTQLDTKQDELVSGDVVITRKVNPTTSVTEGFSVKVDNIESTTYSLEKATVGASDGDCKYGVVRMYGPSVTTGVSIDGTFNVAGMHQFNNDNYLRTKPETSTAPAGYNFYKTNSQTLQTVTLATKFNTNMLLTDNIKDDTGTYTYSLPTKSGTVALISDVETKVDKNDDITGATHTKITYDSKGLVTSGTDITLSDVTDVTATATEVNVLDGITATTTELNYVDGVTSNIQTQLNGKQTSGDYVSYTNNTVTIAGNSKILSKTNPECLYINNGLVMGGTALSAGLTTRGICGVTTPSNIGACDKENLYINYDGNDTNNPNGRGLVLNAGSVGTNLGNGMYSYCVPRGDVVKSWVEAKGYITNSYHDSTKVDANSAITAGTGTKVTYDSKGLVTSSTTLSSSDIPDLSNTYLVTTIKYAKDLNYSNSKLQLKDQDGNALGTEITIASGGGTWGSITGTLSNQTDLNTELNKKLENLTFTSTDFRTVTTIPSTISFSIAKPTVYYTAGTNTSLTFSTFTCSDANLADGTYTWELLCSSNSAITQTTYGNTIQYVGNDKTYNPSLAFALIDNARTAHSFAVRMIKNGATTTWMFCYNYSFKG